jgi:predicted Zn-dependent protease
MTTPNGDTSPRVLEAIIKAIDLDRDSGTRRAIQLLSGLAAEFPDSLGLRSYLGWFHLRCGQFEQARLHATRAVELSPKSEMASLVLFNACWKDGRHEEAVEELKRFTAIVPSAEYRRILNETVGPVR